MIRTRSQPPNDDNLPHLPLLRVPTRTAMKLAITCAEMLQVDTHFMNRRTLPCVNENCPGCEAKLQRRYEAYISAMTTQPTRHVIVALTPRAAKQLWDSAPDPRDLRGTIILLQRVGSRANGPLNCRIEPAETLSGKLPPMPELIAHMMRIWGIKQSHMGQDLPAYGSLVEDPENWTNHENGA